MKRAYGALFWALAGIGRPFGGIRPRRCTHWVARKAFGAEDLKPSAFRWHRDKWGCEFLLHPYYLLDREIIAFGDFDPSLHRFIEEQVKPGMICFDIGANFGGVAMHLGRRVSPGGKVHAFEPVPAVRARLKQHAERNGLDEVIAVHGVALSDKTGKMSMALAPCDVQNQGMASLVDRDNLALSVVCEVQTQTIDDFVREQNITRADLLKIDIQGAELMLLAGGEHTFGSLSPDLLMEVCPDLLKTVGATSADLIRAVERYGYRVFELGRGGLGRQLRAESLSPDYAASNVFCTKRDGKPGA
jgi:FkbM family methyltransferase